MSKIVYVVMQGTCREEDPEPYAVFFDEDKAVEYCKVMDKEHGYDELDDWKIFYVREAELKGE